MNTKLRKNIEFASHTKIGLKLSFISLTPITVFELDFLYSQKRKHTDPCILIWEKIKFKLYQIVTCCTIIQSFGKWLNISINDVINIYFLT